MKKFIYLISPQKIDEKFYDTLRKVLRCKNIRFFQLRLKKIKKEKLIKIARRIKKITQKYKVKLIINDRSDISRIVKADGCHLGQSDGSVTDTKKILKKQIIGVTCHNSKSLAKIAVINKANYLAFGSFNKSKLKPNAKKANLNILKWAKKNLKIPIVAIGGINK